jgi:hypothetical protein
MANKIPNMIVKALAVLKTLDTNQREMLDMARGIMYLWREFYIKTRLEVVPKEYILEFKYKDDTIVSCRMDDLKTLKKLIEQVKVMQIKEDK